ncbi:MAG: hypothetical protein KDK36_13205, partial [Leptospiraceae bacterium]|nr:hypothetical protein [Leptospiraceae bacterium]
KFLKENSENNINYSHVEDSSNEKFNLIGKNNLGEISETIKVQILEDPYSIYQTLENTNESTKIFINSELKEQFRINPKIIPTEISEKKLEERIIELFHKLKKDN